MSDFMNTAHDDRLDRGMALQMDLLRAATSGGATQAGWKAGLGSSHWRTTFELAGPLVGFLLDRTRIHPGATESVGGWEAPRAEAELALRLAADLTGDAAIEEALDAVDALAPAIELVDLFPAPEDPSDVLAENIYHRRWMTGRFLEMSIERRPSRLVADVTQDGGPSTRIPDVEAATGSAAEVILEVARIAQRHGRGLRAGDTVILGSIVPPVAIRPGGSFRYELSGHPPLEVRFTG